MEREQRLKYEMFVRVRNFGVASRDVFPEESAAGKKFGRLSSEVKAIEEQLVRQGQARAEARKVKLGTRRAAMDLIKAVASAGRRVTNGDVAPHPFRLPRGRSATVVLATARLFIEEAEQRKEQFAELGLPPTFLADCAKAVADLTQAVTLQQDSRAARHKARGSIEGALDRGMGIIQDLDASVPVSLRTDPGRLAEWFGARRLDQVGATRIDAAALDVVTPPATPAPPATTPVPGPVPVLSTDVAA
jgi:hypothetical protein